MESRVLKRSGQPHVFQFEKLIEQYKLFKIHKIEAFANTLKRVLDELSKRNFETVSTKDLVSIAFAIEGKLRESISGIRLYTGAVESDFGVDKKPDKTFLKRLCLVKQLYELEPFIKVKKPWGKRR